MLCEFSKRFPKQVEAILDRGQILKRSFREETITDLLMSNLITLGGKNVIVEFPDEPITGADMEWNFVNIDDSTFFQILIQAKRAYCMSTPWQNHYYKELFHKPASSKEYQASTICNVATSRTACFPLYAFYNPKRTCDLARGDGVFSVEGVTLTSGYKINGLVTAASASSGTTLKRKNKRVKTISPFMQPLSSLFCPQNIYDLGPHMYAPVDSGVLVYVGGGKIGHPIPPSPKQIRHRLLSFANENADSETLQSIPDVSSKIPDYVQALIEKAQSERMEGLSKLNKFRVTFISMNPPSIEEIISRTKDMR